MNLTMRVNSKFQKLIIPFQLNSIARAFCCNHAAEKIAKIAYITDVEGDAQYLLRFVKNSDILSFDDEQNICFNDGDEGLNQLVYGGDTCDKGGHDIRVLQLLLDFKRRYPKRVHFILGNRDLNKLRLLQELGDVKSTTLPEHGGIYFLFSTNRVGDPKLSSANVPDDAPERLKWILRDTLGSPDAFEYRRQELKELKAESDQEISDADVVQSYREFAKPSGLLGQYIQHGQLAKRIGNILFIHGALPLNENSTGAFDFPIPWQVNSTIDNLDDWIEELNKFTAQEYSSWKESATEYSEERRPLPIWATLGGYNTGIGGGNLMQYGMGFLPGRTKNPTVVYNTWPHENVLNNAEMARFFQENNLQLIVTGHQPHGDSPFCVKVNHEPNYFIISADTSYSGDVKWQSTSSTNFIGRGKSMSGRGELAVSELLIETHETAGIVQSISTHGILSNGMQYRSTNFLHEEAVGQPTEFTPDDSNDDPDSKGSWWTKCRTTDGMFLISHCRGYKVTNAIVNSIQDSSKG